jgi:hypothetical protein
MPTAGTCTCGCSLVSSVTNAEPCDCGCACCAGEKLTRDEEIAHLHTLEKALKIRLAELEKVGV